MPLASSGSRPRMLHCTGWPPLQRMIQPPNVRAAGFRPWALSRRVTTLHPIRSRKLQARLCLSEGSAWTMTWGQSCWRDRACSQPAPYRRQGSHGLLDLRQDHVPVDVPGRALVQHLAPGAGRQGWRCRRPRPRETGRPSTLPTPTPWLTCSHTPPQRGPRRPPPVEPCARSPPASSWWPAPSRGSVTSPGTGSLAGSEQVAGCGQRGL